MPGTPDSLDATIDALINIGDVRDMQEILRRAPLLVERSRDWTASASAPPRRTRPGQKSLFEMLDALRAVVTQAAAPVERLPT